MRNSFLLLAIVLLICSCAKSTEFDSFTFYESLQQYIKNNKESFLFEDASKAFHFTTSKGTYIKFNKNSFLNHNELFKGQVRIDVTEIYSKTEMIVAGLPTVMSRDLNERTLLTSGGEIHVSAFDVKNDARLDLLEPFSVSVSVESTNTEGQDMGLFELTNDEARYWTPVPSLDSAQFFVTEGENRYRFLMNDLKWVNVDRIEKTFPNTAKVRYLIPPELDVSNAHLLVNIPALPNSIADYNTELPIDESCQIFVIQHKENGYRFGHKRFIAKENHLVDLSTTQLFKGDESDLRKYVQKIIE